MNAEAAGRRIGRIVVLNGASSSGKSTLARNLQALSTSEAFHHVSLDAFRAMEPPGYWDASARDLWPSRTEALCRSINAAAATYARAGESVILDHVLPIEGWTWLARDFAGLRVSFVGVHCELGELVRREEARGDRPAGLAASQVGLHRERTYDFELNTTQLDSMSCAKALYQWLLGSGRL